MKIAFVLHQFLPFYNSGTEQYVYHLAKSLLDRGEEVEVFCFETNFERNRPFTGISKDCFENIPVTRLSGWEGLFPNHILAQYYNPFFGKLFREFLEEEGIEAIHFFHNSYMSVAVIEEAYLAGIPMVVNLMDFWYLCPNVQLLKTAGGLCDGPDDYKECIKCLAPKDANYQALAPYLYGKDAVPLPERIYEGAHIDFLSAPSTYNKVAAMAVRPHFIRKTLELADLIISPSRFMESMFLKNGYRAEQIRICRYGIDLENLRGVKKKASPVLRVGYIGTICAHKGLDVLIKAFRGLEGEDLALEVHGDMGAFPAFAAEVGDLAQGDDRIHFRGRFESEALPRVHEEIDLLVVPSVWYENTPFVILESLAAGTPVIASDLGGLSELIEVGKNGFVFKPGDPDDLRDKLHTLVADRSLQEKLRPDPASTRSLEENAREFLDLYRELAGVSGKEVKARPD